MAASGNGSEQEVRFHQFPPVGLSKRISDGLGGGFLDILENLLAEKELFAFRLDRHGKWLEWLIAEVLYRHCDNTGLAWFAAILVGKIGYYPELKAQAILALESAILGEKTDAKVAIVAKEVQNELKQEALQNAEEVCLSVRTGRAAPASLCAIGSKPTTEERMLRQIVSLLEAAKKIAIVSAMLGSEKSSEERLDRLHAEACTILAGVAIGLPAAATNGSARETMGLIASEIAPEVAAIITHPLNGGKWRVAEAIALRAGCEGQDASDLAIELGLPRLAASASRCAHLQLKARRREQLDGSGT